MDSLIKTVVMAMGGYNGKSNITIKFLAFLLHNQEVLASNLGP
jgi:hypothetical protein